MTARTSVAVVGIGIGSQHINALAALPDLYHLALICDLDQTAATAAAEPHGAASTSDFAAVLADPSIELVSICTPPWLHESQVIAALEAGKHVVCEKPLVGNLAALDRIEAAAQAADRLVFPVYNYRFGPSFQQFLEVVRSGQLGDPLVATVEVGFLRGPSYYKGSWRGTRDGELGGCLASHSIHHFDMLLAALGRPVDITARSATRVNDIETEDCAAGVIEFADGALASFAVTLGAVEQYSRLRLIYRNAVVEFGPGPYETSTEGSWHLFGLDQPASGSGDSGFMAMFRQAHDAIAGAPNHAPTTVEARQTLELLTAMYQSASDGGSAQLPIDPSSPWYESWS